MDALFQGDPRRLAEILQKGDRRIAEPGGGVLRPQMTGLEIAVVEAVQQKVHEIRHHGLSPFGFQKLHDVVVGGGREFHQDLAHDPHPGFLDVQPLQAVEIADDAAHEHVSVDHGLHGLGDQGSRQGEARVGLHAVGIDGDHRDLGHPCLFQGTADEADVVGGPAAAAGLGHDHCCVVQVVFP